MSNEKRTRVEIFLPIKLIFGSHSILEWLAEELAFARGGSTVTTPFSGFYSSFSHTEVIRDSIQILFCDFDLDCDDPKHQTELSTYLNDLRLLLIDVLEEEEVWIVYHPITRVTEV